MSKYRINPETFAPYAEDLSPDYMSAGIDISAFPELSGEDYENFFINPKPPQENTDGYYCHHWDGNKLVWIFKNYSNEEVEAMEKEWIQQEQLKVIPIIEDYNKEQMLPETLRRKTRSESEYLRACETYAKLRDYKESGNLQPSNRPF